MASYSLVLIYLSLYVTFSTILGNTCFKLLFHLDLTLNRYEIYLDLLGINVHMHISDFVLSSPFLDIECESVAVIEL